MTNDTSAPSTSSPTPSPDLPLPETTPAPVPVPEPVQAGPPGLARLALAQGHAVAAPPAPAVADGNARQLVPNQQQQQAFPSLASHFEQVNRSTQSALEAISQRELRRQSEREFARVCRESFRRKQQEGLVVSVR